MRSPCRRLAACILATLLVVGTASCAAPPVAEPPPLRAPRLAASVRHFYGSPISGPVRVLGGLGVTSAALPVDPGPPERALQATVTCIALERMPEDILEPLGREARLLVSDEGAQPIRHAALLLGGSRGGAIPDAGTFTAALLAGACGRAARLCEFRAVLPAGITAAFELERRAEDAPRGLSSSAIARGKLRFSARTVVSSSGASALETAVEVRREGPLTKGGPPERELIVNEPWPLRARNHFALIVPFQFEGEEARAIAAIATVSPPPPPDGVDAARHHAAMAACRADLARDAAVAREAAFVRPLPGAPRPDLARAQRALREPGAERRALFAIAQATGARLAEDVAISADGPLVATVSAAVAVALASAPGGAAGPSGWDVERASVARLLEASRATEEIRAADLHLLRRIGGVLWAEETLEGLLRSATSLEEFDRRLVQLNRALLDDGQPSTRARAFEWLGARGLAPEGYDPIASSEERRAVLERLGIATGGGGT